ncbi:hypothetical protein CBM2629_B90089 [Cupriavidus taiwanensis]|nr:hypothetical protein CBM2629_B90089 [Cupriavidus taiwanensis]
MSHYPMQKSKKHRTHPNVTQRECIATKMSVSGHPPEGVIEVSALNEPINCSFTLTTNFSISP